MSYAQLWHELRALYGRQRPIDLFTGDPVLTECDVAALLDQWTSSVEETGRGRLAAWWRAERARIWAVVSDVLRARQVWDATYELAEALTWRRPRDAGAPTSEGLVRIRGMKDWSEMHIAIKAYFVEHRGADVVGNHKVPRTTHDDVRQLIEIWDSAATRARLDVHGVKGAVATWNAVAAEAKQAIAGADPSAVYAKNVEFWRASQRLAIRVQVGAEEPGDVSFVDALKKNIKKAPERIAKVAIGAPALAIGGAASEAAEAVKGVAKDAANAAKKAGVPLLVGAGVLGAGVLTLALFRK